ncbi:MAG: hypothetical protein WBQ57_11300, partial [Rhodanobacteraceae bacterium]
MPERSTRNCTGIEPRRTLAILLSAIGLCAAIGNARGEVQRAAADGFFIALSAPVAATPAKAWAGMVQVGHWWSDQHTWSGKAANLSLKPEAGGCFCERWKDGSVEHGRVIMVLKDRLLRLDAGLGPLQELALKGILSFQIISDDAGATRLEIDYRVNGASGSALDSYAPQVDAVLGTQLARLVRYIETGNPKAPAEAPAPKAPSDADRRAAIFAAWAKQAAADRGA